MKIFPDYKTILEVDIAGFHLAIAWYAVLILGGAILVYFISLRNAKKIGYGKELLEDYFLILMPLVILGARLWYVIFEWHRYSSNIISAFYIWEGGLGIHGGLITGVIFSYFYFRKKGVNILRIGDCIMPNILIGQAIGRWGNFMNQEAYGQVVGSDYFDKFPNFIKEQMFIDGFYRQPTFLFESVGNIFGFLLITFVYRKLDRRKQGDLIYAYVLWYGLVRFFVEAMRSDSLMFVGLKTAQLISIIFMLIGALGIFGVYDRVFKRFYPFKKEKPTVIFDLDGTLIDSYQLIVDSFVHTFGIHKPEHVLKAEEIDAFVGPPLHETFKRYFDIEKVEEVIETYREFNHEKNDEYIKALPHAKQLLRFLKENDYPIAIYSNKYAKAVKMGLDASGLAEYFDVVVCGDQVEKAKPNAEGILKACTLLQVSHDDVIYVGDGVVDVQAAKNMGAYSIAYVSNEIRAEALEATKPCRIVYDLEELIEIVKEERTWNELVI